MGTQYSHIDLTERRRIQKMRDAKVPVAVIAAELGRTRQPSPFHPRSAATLTAVPSGWRRPGGSRRR
nr:helix-turn-helix domain-containing protein [Azospirillum rugosum]